jgi:hypothetical protein
MPSIFYSAASRRLVKACALNPVSPSLSLSLGLSDNSRGSHELPTGEFSVVGVPFEVDFERVYRRSERLNRARLSYKVRHKSLLKGAQESAPFWRYSVELTYLEDNRTRSRLWLCKSCHQNRTLNDAKVVDGTAYIINYLRNTYCINLATSLLPETLSQTRFSSPFEAAKVAGSRAAVSYTPWQEEEL